MDVVLPVFAWLCLATLIVVSPRVGPHRVRRQATDVATALRTQHAFTAAPEVEPMWPTTEPPCHYGTHHTIADAVTGGVDGLPVTSATYTCRYNGSTHLYGLIAITLPAPAERLEIRHGQVFESAWVVDTPPDGASRGGDHTFDAAFELYFPDRADGAMGLLSEEGIAAMVQAPDRFNLRADDRRLLLWRRDGWSGAAAVVAAVRAAAVTTEAVRLVG
jgi:hypothetical protein